MNIAIIGYGKMGQEVEKLARAKNMNVVSIIDPSHENATHKEISKESIANADVCIDFTHPEAVLENIKKIAAEGKNMVIGTTGWQGHMDDVRKIVDKKGLGIIHASNFSVGVNAFVRIIEQAAKIMNKIEDYDVFGYELHHNNKVDSPSGTARTIAERLLMNIDRKEALVYDKIDRKIDAKELHFASVRAGHIPGTHVVGFDSTADTIELKHTARNREGFALGAVMAASWIAGKKGFYNIDNMMDEIIGGNANG